MTIPLCCLLLRAMTFVFASIFCVRTVSAQEQTTQQLSWYHLSVSHQFSEHLGATTFYDWRREGFGTAWQQSLLRLGLVYTTTSGAKLSAGYDWVRSYRYGEKPIAYAFNEHRIYQQAVMKQRMLRLRVHHRYRLEERFLERKSLNDELIYTQETHELRYRARYRMMLKLPLAKRNIPPRLYVLLSDELFVNFGNGSRNHYFDQNWFQAGVSYDFSPVTNIAIGYMNQYIPKSDLVSVEVNHVLTVGLSLKVRYGKGE